MTEIIRTVAELRQRVRGWRAAGEMVGVVPTMGALHEGHLSLARRARAECDRVITTIFVNPKQFNNPDDLKKYPRTLEADAQLLSGVPVDVVFAPDVDEVYPDGFITTISVGGVSEPLEGRMRPGHFDGVATVVTKLFGMTEAHRGYFGQKDLPQVRLPALRNHYYRTGGGVGHRRWSRDVGLACLGDGQQVCRSSAPLSSGTAG